MFNRGEDIIVFGWDPDVELVVPVLVTDNRLQVTLPDAIDADNGMMNVKDGPYDHQAVAASATDQVLGDTGAAGDYLYAITFTVTAVGAGGAASIKDGAGAAVPIIPASAPIGVYNIAFKARSTSGAWKVTTGADVTAFARGIFTA